MGLGGGGGGTETTTSTSTSEPPAFVKPFSINLLNRGSELSKTFTPIQFAGGQQIVGFSPFEQAAFQQTANRALAGGPGELDQAGLLGLAGAGPGSLLGQGLIGGAGTAGIDTSNLGRFTNGQLGFDPVTNALVNRSQGDLLDRFNTQVAPATAAQFNAAGTFGGTAQGELEAQQRFGLARALGDTEAGIRGDAVNRAFAADQAIAGIRGQDLARQLAAGQALGALGESGRNRQLGAADFFSTLGGTRDQIERQRISDLESTGVQQRGLEQLMRDIDIQNAIQLGNLDLSRLDILGSVINTAGGGFGTTTGTSTGPAEPRPNPFISALSGFGSAAGGLGALFGVPVFCWVARAVYGVTNPRWVEFREWIMGYAPVWLREFYIAHGPQIAQWVERHPWSKRAIRPFMDLARWRLRKLKKRTGYLMGAH